MKVIERAAIDAHGNISLHGREEWALQLAFYDAAGSARDVSAATLHFEVEGQFRRALAAGAISSERVLVLTGGDIAAIAAAQPKNFILVETVSGSRRRLWAGEFRVFGFTVQPAGF